METDQVYDDLQLEAILELYEQMKESDEAVTMETAIRTWFSDGYAERLRGSYLREGSVYIH